MLLTGEKRGKGESLAPAPCMGKGKPLVPGKGTGRGCRPIPVQRSRIKKSLCLCPEEGSGRRGKEKGHTPHKVCVIEPDENKVSTRAARLPSSAGGTGETEPRPAWLRRAAAPEAGGRRGCRGWRHGAAEPGCSRAAAGAAGQSGSVPRGSAALRGDGRWGTTPLRWAAAGSVNTILRHYSALNVQIQKQTPKPLTKIGN